ncbi:AAA family ATPase [Desulfomonile tiedjei]|uniref:Cytidylate kinase n=1 Tax=Desulfomonile tiedjei (strain ATCC 49306 / DSM 6799 / DCB-1) TaxID=706587 RepID=I4CDV4_DESTA|nr:cytidylate kinase-like family protein [Desulfomonile tiedjei]AFM27745.1 cytidylate kinase [Desulfomonile tiedjei DSM 6799]
MSIIVISRGCYSRGSQIAMKVAQTLGYKCISREILLEASRTFDIPEIKLMKAIHDAPTILERFGHTKEKYLSYIRTALLKAAQTDDMVYHGIAGHFFLQGVPHVLKVRIIADFEDRVREEMRRESISEDEARTLLKKDDEERRKWALSIYGCDTADSSLYDIVLNIKTLTQDIAVETIVDMVSLPSFQTTPESQSLLGDLALAAQVESALIDEFPEIRVTAKNHIVFIHVKVSLSMMGDAFKQKHVIRRIEDIAQTIQGVKEVKVTLGSAV